MLSSKSDIALPAASSAAGFSFPEHTGQRRSFGQASIELIVVWPVLVTFVFLVVQALIIWWSQQTLTVANQYTVRAGAINHGNYQTMVTTLVSGMAGLEPQLDQDNLAYATTLAIAQQRFHFTRFAQLDILSPTPQDFREYAEERWDYDLGRDVTEIAVDHYHARYDENTPVEWHEARVLKIRTDWCLPLKIPFVAEMLSSAQGFLGDSTAVRYCKLREGMSDYPLWALTDTAQHSLQSGFRR
ncbi:TadE/TadG family type IV pilus assembly protein [Idiomarina sp.]|uniref:TadE/TadG family type IV pilus assembly protein n=1 Tax=Idiomarina sp. TaxID=1874361 RepID=UPI002633A4F2|nr:TadE/TadG family type IV pilus assembly protein [Idiomarina sp.]